MENQAIVLETLLNAHYTKVWKAITDKNEMKSWYFDLFDFKPEVGFKFQFSGGPSPDVQYLHLCEITEVMSEKKLTYSWRYDGYPGISFVTFELEQQGNKTLLRLTHRGLESFPEEKTDFAKHNFEEGWDYIIHSALKGYLEKMDYQISISVKETDKQVFESLTLRIPQWWSEVFDGSSDKLNDLFTVRFGNTYKTIVIEQILRNEQIVWSIVNSYIDIVAFTNKSEWNGTRIIWTITPVGDDTKLTLTHQGLTSELECYDVCENGWKYYMDSLYLFLTTNKGLPFKKG